MKETDAIRKARELLFKKPAGGPYDPDALEAGIKVEMEHTRFRSVAEGIAKNHLDEDSEYYKKLKKMEAGA